MDRNAINKGRALYYSLFAAAFAFEFTKEQYLQLCQGVEKIKTNPIDEPSEQALKALSQELANSDYQKIKTESDNLFYSPTSSFIPMTASFYDEERDDGKKRVEMIEHVHSSPFRRNSEVYHENEDHIEFIALFIENLLESDNDQLATTVFRSILNPMIDQFCEKVYQHEDAKIYQNIATIFYSFAQCERLLLDIQAPEKSDQGHRAKPNIVLRKTKKAPRKLVERNIGEFGPV